MGSACCLLPAPGAGLRSNGICLLPAAGSRTGVTFKWDSPAACCRQQDRGFVQMGSACCPLPAAGTGLRSNGICLLLAAGSRTGVTFKWDLPAARCQQQDRGYVQMGSACCPLPAAGTGLRSNGICLLPAAGSRTAGYVQMGFAFWIFEDILGVRRYLCYSRMPGCSRIL